MEDDRIWLSSLYTSNYSIGFRFAHSAGAVVGVATMTTLASGVDYNLTEGSGLITEIGDIGTNVPVVVTYTSDYVVPAVFPGALNGSPDLTEMDGDWTGLATASGVYRLGIQAARSFSVVVDTETTSYTAASPPNVVNLEFLDDADTAVPARLDTANCASCHVDIAFHGGSRRGPDTCLLCHGTAGAEDRAVYVAPGQTNTTEGLTISFRTMLHKIHHGAELAAGSDYVVNGFGSGYPNNYSAHTYEEVEFPRLDGGTSACAACHGADNEAWKVPADRDHPDGQDVSTQVWRVTCNSCHDSAEVTAHIEAQTSPSGGESCALCHGDGKEYAVEKMHRRY